MIGDIKRMSGSAGGPINYIIGGKKTKDQNVTVIDWNGIFVSNRMKNEIELIPRTPEEKKLHKLNLWKYAQQLGGVFDARASIADYRVTKPNQQFIIGYSPEDIPSLTPELRRQIDREFLQMMGIHGDIEVTRKRNGKEVKETVHREGMYLICAHNDTNAPHEHIFVSRLDDYGKANKIRKDYLRALEVCRKLSKKYGLHMKLNEEAGITEENGYNLTTQQYKVNEKKCNADYNKKLYAQRQIKEALKTALSWEELEEYLGCRNVYLEIIKHKDTGEAYGAVFKVDYITPNGEDRALRPFSGSDLGREFTFGRIDKVLEANRLKEEKNQERQRLQEYQQTWNRDIRPLYKEAAAVCQEIYQKKQKLWESIEEQNKAISQLYKRGKGIREQADEYNRNIDASNTMSDLLSAVSVALLFINPLLAIALRVLGISFTIAEGRSSEMQRRTEKAELMKIYDRIKELKKEKAALSDSYKELCVQYKENKEIRDHYKFTENKIAANLAVSENKTAKQPQAAPAVENKKEQEQEQKQEQKPNKTIQKKTTMKKSGMSIG